MSKRQKTTKDDKKEEEEVGLMSLDDEEDKYVSLYSEEEEEKKYFKFEIESLCKTSPVIKAALENELDKKEVGVPIPSFCLEIVHLYYERFYKPEEHTAFVNLVESHSSSGQDGDFILSKIINGPGEGEARGPIMDVIFQSRAFWSEAKNVFETAPGGMAKGFENFAKLLDACKWFQFDVFLKLCYIFLSVNLLKVSVSKRKELCDRATEDFSVMFE